MTCQNADRIADIRPQAITDVQQATNNRQVVEDILGDRSLLLALQRRK